MAKGIMSVILKHGQYKDVGYITKDAKVRVTRCLVVPAKEIETYIKS